MTDPGSKPKPRSRQAAEDARTSASSPATELFRLEATRGGNRVVQLRAVSTADGYAVECRVDAVDGRRVEAGSVPSHSFAMEAEAKAFVDEAAAALQYLGCHVRGGSVYASSPRGDHRPSPVRLS